MSLSPEPQLKGIVTKLFCRQGFYLQANPDGSIQGTPEDTSSFSERGTSCRVGSGEQGTGDDILSPLQALLSSVCALEPQGESGAGVGRGLGWELGSWV